MPESESVGAAPMEQAEFELEDPAQSSTAAAAAANNNSSSSNADTIEVERLLTMEATHEADQAVQAAVEGDAAAGNGDTNGASETPTAPDEDKCPVCELPSEASDGGDEDPRAHVRRLLAEAAAGSLPEFDAIKRHWQNFGANLPGFIATPYCAHCRLHYQGFLRYAAHCREAATAPEPVASAPTPPTAIEDLDENSTDARLEEPAEDAAEKFAAATAAYAASKVEHERRFEELVAFVFNISDESASVESQRALARGFLCPAGQLNCDMFQLKADFVFANKDSVAPAAAAPTPASDGDTAAAAAAATAKDDSARKPLEVPLHVGPPLLACLVCHQTFRSVRRHLDDALWGVDTPIFRGRHGQIAESRTAHLHAWLGHESTQRLLQDGLTGIAPHCPACGCHFTGFGRLLLHLQHDIDTPGHRQLADRVRECLVASEEEANASGSPDPVLDWIAKEFVCEHGGSDPDNGILERLRLALDKRRVEASLAASSGGAASALGGGNSTGAGGNKRPYSGGGPGFGVGRKVARISRGGGGPSGGGGGGVGGGGGGGFYPHRGGRGGGGGWRRY